LKLFISRRRSRTPGLRRAASVTALVALFLTGTLVTLLGGASAAVVAVPLGTAGSFGVLAGAGITNTGPTTVNGDLGTYPTTTMTGTASLTVTGTNHGGDAVTQGAKTDLDTAYNTAAGEGPTTPIAADLAGQTLTPGVYNSASSIGLTGALTLNAGGDPNAVFVFQAGSTLTTASASSVNLINGAQSCNVFWQVGSSATLGTGSTFRGTILALTSITVTTGVTIDGRVLARNGAVTLDTDTITRPTCAAAVTTTAVTTTAPVTTVVTTAPVTTAPVTTAPATTAVTTTAPATTAATTTVATTTTTSGTAAAKKAAAVKAAKVAAAKRAAAAKKAKQPTFAKRATRRAGFTG
jgi:type VI secretion system secreted protein VgrG